MRAVNKKYLKYNNAILYRANKELYEVFYEVTQGKGFDSLNPIEKLKAFWNTLVNFKKEKTLYFKIITMYENKKEDFNTSDEYLKKAYDWGQKIHNLLKKIIIKFYFNYIRDKNPDEIILILWMTCVSVLNTIEVKEFYLQNYFGINTKELEDTFFEYIAFPLINNKV